MLVSLFFNWRKSLLYWGKDLKQIFLLGSFCFNLFVFWFIYCRFWKIFKFLYLVSSRIVLGPFFINMFKTMIIIVKHFKPWTGMVVKLQRRKNALFSYVMCSEFNLNKTNMCSLIFVICKFHSTFVSLYLNSKYLG